MAKSPESDFMRRQIEKDIDVCFTKSPYKNNDNLVLHCPSCFQKKDKRNKRSLRTRRSLSPFCQPKQGTAET